MKSVLLFVVLVLNLLTAPEGMAQQARLLTDNIVPGDLAILEVSYRNKQSSMFTLDTTPLELDFEVIDTRSSTKMERKDGSLINMITWKVWLSPRRTGKLRIPPLRIREVSTPPLELTVRETNPWQRFGEDVRIELNVDKISPRVGEQFTVIVRFASNQPISSGFLSDPEVVGASKLGLGRDQVNRLMVEGREYEVMERSIAYFAESAGPLIIKPATFRGSLRAMPTIEGLSESRHFLRRSESVKLDIRSRTSEVSPSNWYPLESAALTQEWHLPSAPLKPGDQIKRRISLKTIGLPAERFGADLFQTEVRGVASYLDQPQQTLSIANGKLQSSFSQDQLFIINREGPVLLPGLHFNFWNTMLDEASTVSVAGKLIDVPPATTDLYQQNKNKGASSALMVLSLAILGGALVLVMLLRWLDSLKQLRRFGYRANQLKKACLNNDATEAARQLLAWGRTRHLIKQSQGLRALATAVDDPPLQGQIFILDAILFAAGQPSWSGKETWSLFSKYGLRGAPQTKTTDGLPPLYP